MEKYKIDWQKALLIGVVIVLLIFLFKQCRKAQPVPKVIKSTQVVKDIAAIDAAKKQVEDSLAPIIAAKEKAARDWESKHDDLMAMYLNEENDISEILAKKVPDTCKKVVAELTGKFNQLKSTSAQKDNAARNTINSLNSGISDYKRSIAAKEKAYADMKITADTCAKALLAMEKYSKQMKPRREINAGLEVSSPYINLKPAIGIGLGYRDRKGMQVNVAVYSNQVVTFGIKKTLFRF